MVEPTKRKPRRLQVFAHDVGFGCAGGQVFQRTPLIHAGAVSGELPDVLVEAAELLRYLEEGLCVGNGGGHFQAVAHDAGVGQEGVHFALAVTRYQGGIEIVEDFAIAGAPAQDCVPTEAGLRAVEHQEFEEQAIVVDGDSLLLVVVGDGEFVSGPGAAVLS
jgi:hypothetical protein